MSTKTVKTGSGSVSYGESVRLTRKLQEQFLNSIEAKGRKEQTVRAYRRSVEELYDFLPEDKRMTARSIEEWRECLKTRGLSDSAVNQRLTAVNSLLKYCGMKGLTASLERIDTEEQPEMSRDEYLHFLSAAKAAGREKEYFLIKVFACTAIGVGELDGLTVEACREGAVQLGEGPGAPIPGSLQKELLGYAERHGIDGGPVFVTKKGRPMDRSNIAKSIRSLAESAGMDSEKCTPRALHRLYLSTQDRIREEIRPIEQQAYESLLYTEQTVVAWE